MPKIIPFQVIHLDAKSFHPIIRGKIADIPINLILDTGASRTVLGKHIAHEFPTIDIGTEEIIAAGVNAQTIEVEYVTVPEIILGEQFFHNMQVFSADLKGISEMYENVAGFQIDGLIGCDFLNNHNATINFKQRKVILYP